MSAAGAVTFLDHTADVGMDVAAPRLDRLFHAAAVGMVALLRGREEDDLADDLAAAPADPGADPGSETGEAMEELELTAGRPAELLADWLKELLFLHEVRHRDYVDAEFRRLTDRALNARVTTEVSARAVREIKGVTYHQLSVVRVEGGWTARVIFDV